MKKGILYMALFFIGKCVFGQNLQISGGNDYSVTICSNSVVYAWGNNSSGQVVPSSPGATLYATPTSITGLPGNIRQVDAGSSNTAIAVDCNGRVWTWGGNSQSQLGQPVAAGPIGQLGSVPGIGNGQTYGQAVYVSGGSQMSFALLANQGQVLSWGRNTSGDLGRSGGTTSTPGYVVRCSGGNLTGIVQIEGGDATGYALDQNGNVWSWGESANNALGRTNGTSDSFCADLVQADYNNDGTADGPLINIVQLSAGDTHGLAIDANGAVWSWGGDWGPGQVGRGMSYGGTTGLYASKVTAPNNCTATGFSGVYLPIPPFIGDPGQPKAVFIAAGQQSSAVVLNNGRVVTFGSNSIGAGGSGTLGQGPTAVSSGCPRYVLTSASSTLSGIISVSDGDGWYFATDINNNVYQWGANARSTLANNGITDQSYAIPVTLPTGCSLIAPCASKPNLGVDAAICPTFSINTNQLGQGYSYLWQYANTLTGSNSWTFLSSGTSASFTSVSGTNYGHYRLQITDTRGSIGVLCGSCPMVSDTIRITPPNCTPTNPNLGANLQVCQPVNQLINSNLSNPNLIFQWEYSPSSSIAGFNIVSTGAGLNSYAANALGFWRVSVISNLTCAGCIPSATSVIRLTTATSAFNAGPSTICATVASTGVFTITTSLGGGAYLWYSTPSGGTPLSTLPGTTITGVDISQTSTLAGCNGRVIYVQDQNSFSTTLNSTTSGNNTQICSTYGSAIAGNRVPTAINVTRNVSLQSLSVVVPNDANPRNWNLRLQIFTQASTVAAWCGGCSANVPWVDPNNNTPAFTANMPVSYPANYGPALQVISTTGISLTPGRYWLRVVETTSNAQAVLPMSCTPSVTCAGAFTGYLQNQLWDNSGNQAVALVGSGQDNPCSGGTTGAISNMVFFAGNVSACSRIPVCAGLNCPLNVTYANFTGTKINEGILLRWTTLSELNSSHFVVEKSTDGLAFVAIGNVNAKGKSTGWTDYSFLDKTNNKGTIYYRLVQYDLDNGYFVSSTIAVNVTPLADFQVVPNPNHGTFTLKALFNASITFEVKIHDSVGHLLFANVENASGDYSKEFNMNGLAPGVYFVSVRANETYIVKKVIVE